MPTVFIDEEHNFLLTDRFYLYLDPSRVILCLEVKELRLLYVRINAQFLFALVSLFLLSTFTLFNVKFILGRTRGFILFPRVLVWLKVVLIHFYIF